MLTRTEAGPERNQLENRINDVFSRWKNLRKVTADRQKQLERLVPTVISFVQIREEFVVWLSESEQKLADVNVKRTTPGDLDAMINQQEDMRVHRDLNSLILWL